MKYIQKIKQWRKHHRIELLGAIAGVIVLVLFIDFLSIFIYVKSRNRDLLENKAIYVRNFTTSLSGNTGNIAQVYVNPDRTKCVILLYFDSSENLVTDASKYQVYVKGYDIEKGQYAGRTKSNPVGGYYIFGTTGYAAIYMTDANGFAKQCLECIVRCNELLTTNAKVSDEAAAERDASYAHYDQWRIIINPTGKSAKVCDFLDDFDIVSLYQDAVIDANESTIRQKLTSDVSSLYTYMKQIEAYRNNLKSLGVKLPSLPEYVSGDSFSYDDTETVTLVYKPEYMFKGGMDFDWFHYTLHDKSFMEEVKDPSMSDTQFFNSLQDYSTADRFSGQQWYLADGTQIARNSSSSTQLNNLKSINENITKYEDVLQSYYNLKKQYQCTDMVSYLTLEANMVDAGKYFTSNYDENTIIVW